MKPIKIGSKKSNSNHNDEKLTSAEMGYLWASYTGNSMSKCILSYYLQHVEDEDIKSLLENALNLSKEFINDIKKIFKMDNFPIPIGFTEEDVNLNAPRLYEDEFYVHYLYYASRAGLSIYTVAIPLVFRENVKVLFQNHMSSTLELIDKTKNILINRGFIIKPPYIPTPDKAKFVKNDFLNGFFGHIRPLHALEIAHLYSSIENSVTNKALILGFSQVAKMEKVRQLFIKGKDITHKGIEQFQHQLNTANLQSPIFLDHLVTPSTISPFSDKIMLFQILDMFAIKIRALGNSMSVNGRHDIGFIYAKSLMTVSKFLDDVSKIMIENGWMEQPPEALDRENLK